MTSCARPISPTVFTLRKLKPLALGLLLICGRHGGAAAEALATARVERWIDQPLAMAELPERVICKSDLTAHTGPWLLVSRAWGGSPHLRHYQLVRWEDNARPATSHVTVRWGHCPEQGR